MWNMLNAVLCGMLCEMWCDARGGGVMHVANILHDPKCGVMWCYVDYVKWGMMWLLCGVM